MNCKQHTYDETGHCFECDAPEPSAERKARLNRERVARHRAAKNDSGLVKVEVWIKPEHRERLLKYVKRL